jgi:acyl-CoA dehydrogenase
VISGKKVWTSLAQVATRILLLARTTPLADCAKPTDGMSLFYAAFDRTRIEARVIEKMGRAAVDSNQVFIDELEVPESDRIGEEGMGFRYLLESLNPERILIGAEAVGIGRAALRRPPNMPRSGSSSSGPSARTKRSSILWPRAGWSWRPPTS